MSLFEIKYHFIVIWLKIGICLKKKKSEKFFFTRNTTEMTLLVAEKAIQKSQISFRVVISSEFFDQLNGWDFIINHFISIRCDAMIRLFVHLFNMKYNDVNITMIWAYNTRWFFFCKISVLAISIIDNAC